MPHDTRRVDAVMREVRRGRRENFPPPQPGEDPAVVAARQLKAWQTMCRLMQEAREREDGTWYRT